MLGNYGGPFCILVAMGLLLASTIIGLWCFHLVWTLRFVDVLPTSLWTYVHVLVQAYLSTGLFITAHDAIHGTVLPSKKGNQIVGTIASFLFAGLSYSRLERNHWRHHNNPAHDAADPDYHPSNTFIVWFGSFMLRYSTIWQFLVMGLAYNGLSLLLHIPESRLWVFWIVPLFLAAFQLFMVGTYWPHRKPHSQDMPHNARSMKKNHLLAMVACYFFGYHTEHHLSPRTPWWLLWKVKEERIS